MVIFICFRGVPQREVVQSQCTKDLAENSIKLQIHPLLENLRDSLELSISLYKNLRRAWSPAWKRVSVLERRTSFWQPEQGSPDGQFLSQTSNHTVLLVQCNLKLAKHPFKGKHSGEAYRNQASDKKLQMPYASGNIQGNIPKVGAQHRTTRIVPESFLAGDRHIWGREPQQMQDDLPQDGLGEESPQTDLALWKVGHAHGSASRLFSVRLIWGPACLIRNTSWQW